MKRPDRPGSPQRTGPGEFPVSPQASIMGGPDALATLLARADEVIV
jgi:hypothetical protein